MAAYRWDDLKVTCELTALHWDQLRAQRSVTSIGELYLYSTNEIFIIIYHVFVTCYFNYNVSQKKRPQRNFSISPSKIDRF